MSANSIKTVKRVVLVASLIAALLAIASIVSNSSGTNGLPSQSTPKVPEFYGEVPDFSFLNQSKESFGKAQLLGRVSIANFIFTRCRTVCPVFTMKMKRVAEQTPEEIQLLSFSVDPEYDTPERLAAYAAEHGVDTKRWHFLTGDAKAIKETVAGALKISMEREGVDEEGIPDIVHGGHFVLLDGMGRIRGYYNSDDPERIQIMIKHASWLAQQVSQN
ncbi:MAG: SCO family protein [Myxococcales bacterium]|nr:SCO family protein [Myxococcales bacterium]